MNGSTRNNLIFFILFVSLIASCNLPAADTSSSSPTEREVLWDLSLPEGNTSGSTSAISAPVISATPTPQLVKAIDFNSAFTAAQPLQTANENTYIASGTNDAAQWLFYDPAEYSAQSMETLYAAFQNAGEREWDERYYLEFFAGADPSDGKTVHLDSRVLPGGQAVFRIPIRSRDASWKACWHLKDPDGNILYEFCYNHGSGENTGPEESAQTSSSSADSSGGVYWAFVKKSGKAPAKVSNEKLSAEFAGSSPATQHTYKAYDHVEDFSVSFVNQGTETWDSSYSLKFYSGYNWFHTDSVSLGQTVEQGETATFTMPMEIIEDNDKWVTCWYLSSPDGQNLSAVTLVKINEHICGKARFSERSCPFCRICLTELAIYKDLHILLRAS